MSFRVIVALVGIGALTSGGCGGGVSPSDLAGWNVLLVTIDTLRADRLGFTGWEAAETPVMDRLAEEGVVFETVLASAPVTLPSHATILTGRYPPGHGALDNGVYALPEDVPTLASIVKDAGYETAAVMGAYVLHSQYGLARAFDLYEDRFSHPRGVGAAERRAGVVVDRAAGWLVEREPGAPFLLWAHFYDPHAPYDPPASYRARFDDPYDGEIAYTDECLGRLLSALRDTGELCRTLVVVTSDHGEAFGDGGEETHGLLLRESTLRVPWILWAPESLPKGLRVQGAVSNADILPTVLALLGLDAPADLDGVSVVAAVADRVSRGRTVYSETRLPLDEFGWSELAGARDDRWARVVGPIPETYDLSGDPGQSENLDGEQPEPEERLDRFIAEVRAGGRDAARRALPEEEIEALRALGYVLSNQEIAPSGVDPKTRLATFQRTTELTRSLERGLHAEVLTGAEAVLAEDPENRVARSLRGQAYVGLGRAAEGIADLRAVFEATGSADHDGAILTRALAQTGQVDESERLLRQFIAAQPSYAEHRFNLGLLLAGDGRAEEARDAYEGALERNPSGVHILCNLAVSLASSGEEPDRALELVERAVELAGQNDRPRLLRAAVLHKLGREEDAMAAARELLRAPRLQGVRADDVAAMIRRWREE